MRRFFLYLIMCAAALVAMAQPTIAEQQLAANHNRSGSNHYAYPYPAQPLPKLTPAPAGYEPFFINHYGRHGSRWLTKQSSYDNPVKALELLQEEGALTKQGEVLLDQLRKVAIEAKGRAGDLSDVGAEQHQGIAQRMCQNFPEVFAGDATIDARSTVWIRCILSMANEVQVFKAYNPKAKIFTNASYHDMYYTGWGYGEDTLANPQRKVIRHISDSIFDARINATRFMSQFVNDTTVIAGRFKSEKFMEAVFDIAGSLQNHHAFDGMNLFQYFTDGEIYDLWKVKNIYWYLQWANSPQGGNRMPFIERALLTNMIETADRAIADREHHGAALRFGHETCVLPLACILELDNVNYSGENLDELHEHWRNYEIFPMGCNIQMVFYRNATCGDDVLVKVLFNEHEATLPFETDIFPYYHWKDIKPYYLNKLKTVIEWPE